MSKEIDQRVVEMQFDNKQFEKNAATTLSTLDKLKQKLNLSGATKGLENLGTASKKCDMSHLGKAAEAVGVKFSAMQVMGVTALANITNSAVNAGKQLIRSLTITPVKTGFQEYELKMGSIQTIMASTGESLATVNQYLEDLNEYSDKTIYSFSDMTSNIGKFTNAGVKLEDAVLAMKGISNEAAVSGANANEASRAMYNFAQALSAGYVKLIDWKSIENANMATVEFKNQLIETALSIGTVTKASDGLYKTLDGNTFNATKNFNEVFQDQWMTSEVLIETLKKYADETTDIGKKAYGAAQDVKTFTMMMDTLKESIQSGWAQSWELIIGNFEEAKSFWTSVSNALGKVVSAVSEVRNNFLEGVFGSPWEKIEKHIDSAGISVDDFRKKLVKTAEEHGHSFKGMTSDEEKFNKLLKEGWLTKDLFYNTIDKYAGSVNKASKSTDDMTAKLEYFQKVVREVWHGDYKNGIERVEALTAAGYDYAEVQDLVNKTVDDHTVSIEDLTDAQLKHVGYTDEEIEKLKKLKAQAEDTGTPLNKLIEDINKPSGRVLLLETFANVLKEIKKPLDAIKESWDKVFGDVDLSQFVYNIIEYLHELSEKFTIAEEDAKSFGKICEGAFAIFQLGTSIVSLSVVGGLKILDAILKTLGTDILGVCEAIAEYIIKFRDWIKEHTMLINTWDKFGKIIAVIIEGIKLCIDEFLKLEVVQNVISQITDLIKKLFDGLGMSLDSVGIDSLISKIADVFLSIRDWIKSLANPESVGQNFVLGIIQGIGNAISDLVNAIINIGRTMIETVCNVLGIESPSTEGKYIGSNFMLGIVEGLKNGASKVWAYVKDFFLKFKEYAKNIDIGAVLSIALTVGMLLLVKRTIDVIESLTKPLDKLGDMFEGIGSMAKSFGKAAESIGGYFDSMKRANTAKIIIAIAIAIAALAGSIYLLSTIDTKKMFICIGAIALLAGIIVVLALAMSKLGSVGDVGKFSTFMLALSTSMLLIAFAMKQLGSISQDQVTTILQTFTILIVGLGVLIVAAGSLKRADVAFAKLGFMLLAMSASLLIMTTVMKQMSELDSDSIFKAIGVIAAIGILFAGIVAVSQFSGKYGIKAGIMLLGMSAALLIMIGVIKLAAKLSVGEVLKGITVVALVGVLFASIITISQFAGKYAWRAGIMLLTMSAALLIMGTVIKQLAKINTGDIFKGLAVVAAIEVLFAAIIAVSYFAGRYAVRAGIMLLLMSGALLILTGVIYILSRMDPSGLSRSVEAITTLGKVFALLIGVSYFAKDIKANLILMLVTITMLAGIVAAFTFIEPEKLIRATSAMVVLMLSFTAMIAATKFMGNPIGILKALIPLVAVVALIGGLVIALSYMKIDTALETCAAISMLLLVMSGILLILQTIRANVFVGVGALAVLALVIGELGIILALFDKFNVDVPIEMAKSLSLLLISMSGALVLLGAVGLLGPAAFIGIGALAALIVGIGGIVVAIGALNKKFPALEEFLDFGIPVLEKIGKAIGAFFGGIVGGFVEGTTSGLPGLAEDLSAFMENIKPFLDGVKGIDTSVTTGISTLSDAVLQLTKADLLNRFTSAFGGDDSLAQFAKQLVPFGTAIKDFANEVAGVNTEAITSSANAAKALADMAAVIPNTGGLTSLFSGDNDMITFGKQLPIFGRAMKAYSVEVNGVNAEAITASANAAKAMADMASAIPNCGGMVTWFAGNNDLTTFGLNLPVFGKALKAYSIEVNGVNADAITASATAAKALADMTTAIPNSGGMVAWFTGDNDLTMFSEKLPAFGSALSAYSLSVSNVNSEAIINSASAAKALANMIDSIPNSGGMVSWFAGENDFTTFGSNLPKFGRALASYSIAVSGINAEAVETSITSAKKIVKFVNGLEEINLGNIDNLTTALSKLGSASINGFVSAFANSSSTLIPIGAGLADAIISGFESRIISFKMVGAASMTIILTTMGDYKVQFKAIGIESMSQFINGILRQKHRLPNIGSFIVSEIIKSIKSLNNYNSFYNAGKYLVSGFSSGIRDNAYSAKIAARAMAAAAAEAAKDELDEHSPSKVGYWIGDYFGIAFVNGISDNIKNAYKTSSSMALSARDGITEALSDLAYAFDGDLEITPRIAPVVDLGNVEAGAASINSMLSLSPSLGVLSNLRSINSRTNSQNGTNNDVVSAIDKLNKNIKELERNSYNFNGLTYEESSDVADALKTLVRAAKTERRV